MNALRWKLNLFDENGSNVSTTNDTFDTYEKSLAGFQVACDLLYRYPSYIRLCRMDSYIGDLRYSAIGYQYWAFRRGLSGEWTFSVHWWTEGVVQQYHSYVLDEYQIEQICAFYAPGIQIAI